MWLCGRQLEISYDAFSAKVLNLYDAVKYSLRQSRIQSSIDHKRRSVLRRHKVFRSSESLAVTSQTSEQHDLISQPSVADHKPPSTATSSDRLPAGSLLPASQQPDPFRRAVTISTFSPFLDRRSHRLLLADWSRNAWSGDVHRLWRSHSRNWLLSHHRREGLPSVHGRRPLETVALGNVGVSEGCRGASMGQRWVMVFGWCRTDHWLGQVHRNCLVRVWTPHLHAGVAIRRVSWWRLRRPCRDDTALLG